MRINYRVLEVLQSTYPLDCRTDITPSQTFIGTVVPFAEFYWLLKMSTPPIANTFAYIAPIVAVLLGWAILDEPVTYLTIIATIVILIGSVDCQNVEQQVAVLYDL